MRTPEIVCRTFPAVPSLEDLETFVEQVRGPLSQACRFNTLCLMQAFPSLAKMSYKLVKDQEVFQSQEQWLSYVSRALEAPLLREIFVAVSDRVVSWGCFGVAVMAILCDMKVRSLQKAFSSVKKEEGLSWLGVACAKDVADTWKARPLDLDARLSKKVFDVTGWTTVKVSSSGVLDKHFCLD